MKPRAVSRKVLVFFAATVRAVTSGARRKRNEI
jgi:hypothetical protein